MTGICTETSGKQGTRLSAICLGIMEAAWLATILVVPLAFSPHALFVFEPFKFALLRMLAMLALAAWVANGFSGGDRGGSRKISWTPLIWAGGLGLAHAISSLCSVNPWASWMGSPEMAHGTFSFFCCFVLFAVIAFQLRTRAQIYRLVDAILAGSLAVGVFAILQRLSLYTIQFEHTDPTRAFSFIGHPIPLGAYIGMCLPLGVWRLLVHRASMRRKTVPSAGDRVALFVYWMVIGIQAIAFVLANSRGPVVALLASAVFAACALGREKSIRRFTLAAMATLAGLFLCLVALNYGVGPFKELRSLPVLQRFANIVPAKGETSDPYRSKIWQAAPRVYSKSNAFQFPDGSADKMADLRPFVGYGPESGERVVPHYWLYDSPGAALESRFHNWFWDTQWTLGVLGLVTLGGFIIALFSGAFRAMGVIPLRHPLAAAWMFPLAGAAAVACILALVFGAGFAGLGCQIGMVVGLALFAFAFGRREGFARPGALENDGLLLAILVALAGHIVETGFAFEVSSTTMLLWCLSGLAMAVMAGIDPDLEPTSSGASPGAAVCLSVLPTGVMLFGFVTMHSNEAMNISAVLEAGLAKCPFKGGASHLIPLLFLPTWIAYGFLFSASGFTFTRENSRQFRRRFLLVLAVSAMIAVLLAVFKAACIATIGPIPAVDAAMESVLRQVRGFDGLHPGFLAFVLVTTLWLGAELSRAIPAVGTRSSRFRWAVALACGGLCAWIIFGTISRPMIGQSRAFFGNLLATYGRSQFSAKVLERALSADSRPFAFRAIMTDEMVKPALASGNRDTLRRAFEQAAGILTDGQTLSRLDYSNAYLGKIYYRWAFLEIDPAKRREVALKARDALAAARIFSPPSHPVWIDSAFVEQFLLDNPNKAREFVAEADRIATAAHSSGAYGHFYAALSRQASMPLEKRFYAENSIHYFTDVLDDIQRNGDYPSLLELGNSYCLIGNLDEAKKILLQATQAKTTANKWKAHSLLASLFMDQGDITNASNHARSAWEAAPPDEKKSLERLRQDLGLDSK